MSTGAYPAVALPQHGSSSRSPRARGSVSAPLLLAGLCVVALAVLWLLATHVEATRVRDAELLRHFALIEGERVNDVARGLLHLLEPGPFTIWAAAIVLFAIARNRPRLALAVAVVMAFAPISADLLKPLLAEPHVGFGRTIGAGSWPSGHATAATALALSALLVTPRRWWALAAPLALAFIAAVGVALLIRVWHMPSDVLGGYLLGTLWIALAVSCLRAADRRWPRRR
ncbi:MAG TPA: phosphatase PAP2 family protein [Solirubrobacteraceae bacterium]|nr:phosphatase PAP2 family protein [Solirubrobacteraceae bacterium]